MNFFSRNVLNVWKFTENIILEQIANNKLQNRDNDELYKTTISDFKIFDFSRLKLKTILPTRS